MQNATINVNGQIVGNDASVSVFDRSYLYGDSLYEVARTYHGQFFRLEEHLGRLEKSAQLCQMALDQSIIDYHREIYRTFDAFQKIPGNENKEAYTRIIISRGEGKIGFGLGNIVTPTQYTIIVLPVESPSLEQREQGVHMQIVERLRNDPRALSPAMKSGNYLNNLLAYLEASNHGFDDALLCNSEGFLTEGTTFNIFYIRRGILATPPLEVGILDGITRREVIRLAQNLKLPVREVRFKKELLYEADEIFLSSSVKEILAITQVDQKIIGNGKRGPMTQQLYEAYQKLLPEKGGPRKTL